MARRTGRRRGGGGGGGEGEGDGSSAYISMLVYWLIWLCEWRNAGMLDMWEEIGTYLRGGRV